MRLGLHERAVQVTLPEALEERLRFDFGMFESAAEPQVHLSLQLSNPPLPAGLDERFRGGHFVCFGTARERYVMYPETGWLRWSPGEGQLEFFGQDAEKAYLRLQLCIQSRLGELLEQRGLHRLHGLGLARAGQGALVLLPPRGGKSTLALEILRNHPDLGLFSEDTPLLDRAGRLWPYPFRLGFRSPPKGLAYRQHDGKWQVDARHFRERWQSGPLPCRHLILGAWTTDVRPRWRRLNPWRALPALLRDGLLGYGVPQLLELHWPLSNRQRLDRLGLAWKRLSCLLAQRMQVWELWLTPSPQVNLQALRELLAR